MNSIETGEAPNFENAFSDKAIRQGFIRKVYAILLCQLLISFAATILGSVSFEVKIFLVNNWWLAIVGIFGSFVLLIPMLCIKSLRRKTPTNYILLFSFTFCYSILLSYVGAAYETDTILIAVLITGAIVIGLTLFACQTKIDFTLCTGVIFVLFLCFMLSGIGLGVYSVAFPNRPLLEVIWASLGAGLVSLFIVVDTQMIVGGGRSLEISPEEYCYAAFVLYIDIIRLFLYILRIVAELKK